MLETRLTNGMFSPSIGSTPAPYLTMKWSPTRTIWRPEYSWSTCFDEAMALVVSTGLRRMSGVEKNGRMY